MRVNLSLTLALASIQFSLSSFIISDYIRSSPSLASFSYDSNEVHDFSFNIPEPQFQWILLGQERDCEIKVDRSPWFNGILSLQGKSTRFRPLPKKQYEVIFKTKDGVSHNLIFRHSYRDPSYSREKLTHDAISNAGGVAVTVTHANLYINGEYNGLYQVYEGIDAKMLTSRFHGSTPSVWYYIQRTFSISVRDERGTLDSTSTDEILDMDVTSLSDEKYAMYHPIHQVSNASRPVTDTMNFTSLAAAKFAKRFFGIVDITVHNFYIAEDPSNSLLHLVLWDTDKTLGVGDSKGKSITISSADSPYVVLDRALHFSHSHVMTPVSDTDSHWYDSMTEYDAFVSSSVKMLQDDGPLSNHSISVLMENMRESLTKSAERDAHKWQRWYCSSRMNFNEAMDELEQLLHDRRYNYYNVLTGNPTQQIEGHYQSPYDCDDQWTGKGYVGMYALLSVVLVLNVMACLIPSSEGTLIGTRKESGGGVYEKGGGVCDEAAEVEDDNDLRVLVSSTSYGVTGSAWRHNTWCSPAHTEQLLAYGRLCWRNVCSYDYLLNVAVAVFLLVAYVYYARLDVLDDSEILGKPYMQDTKYIWIYFAVLVNVAFLVRSDSFRLFCWVLIVLSSNLYGIVDLISYVGAEGQEEGAVNSHGVALTIDNDSNPRVFVLFVFWRVSSQLLIMLYSFRVPGMCRAVTTQLDAQVEKGEDLEGMATEGSSTESQEMEEGLAEIELKGGQVSAGVGYAKVLELTQPEESREETTAAVKVTEKARPLQGDDLLQYKNKMKRFMRVNMAVFISICVGYAVYLAVQGNLARTAAEIFYSTVISLSLLINIRAFYSCVKWFWLHAFGVDTPTLDLMFSTRDESDHWSLDAIKELELTPRRSPLSFLLCGVGLSTEKKIRTVDGWTKKVAHTYDGLVVFVLSAVGFSSGDSSSETYSLAYAISLIYMLLYVVSYNSNGPLAWIVYGAKARVMDGFLGRENEIFGYMFDKYMLPVSAPLLLLLRHVAGDDDIVYLSWYIFMPIIVGDSVAEVVGATWGQQRISVWGMGEINKKSWEGTFAMFLSSFLILVAVNVAFHLSWQWYIFAFVNCLVTTFIELYAYRSTDNVCMMIFSSSFCLLFVYLKNG